MELDYAELLCNLLTIVDDAPPSPSFLCFYLNCLEINKKTREQALNSRNLNNVFQKVKSFTGGHSAILMLSVFQVESAVFWDETRLFPNIPRWGDCIMGLKLSGPITLKLQENPGDPWKEFSFAESFELKYPYFFRRIWCPLEIITGRENLLAVKWAVTDFHLSFFESRNNTGRTARKVLEELKEKLKNKIESSD
jgi:hypothetical protein